LKHGREGEPAIDVLHRNIDSAHRAALFLPAMPQPQPHVASRRAALAQARANCRRAYGRAKAAGGLTALTTTRYYAETLTAVRGKPLAVQVEMFERTAMLLRLLADRAEWHALDEARGDDAA
jgi:hypothetical protein